MDFLDLAAPIEKIVEVVSTTSETVLIALAMTVLFSLYKGLSYGWNLAFPQKSISGMITTYAIYVLNMLFGPIALLSVYWLHGVYEEYNLQLIPTSFWSDIPFWIAGILAIICYDFADYWNHRIMHNKWLWPIHAIHHSDEHVNCMTTFRVHFLEVVFMKISYIFIVSWAGFSPEAAAFGAVLKTIHSFYVHGDVDWTHGPFKLFIASPRFHRWHHANYPEAFGKNLSNVIPFWDYVFGTYYDPGACKKKMGADGVPHADPIRLITFPFIEWAKMIKAALIKTDVSTALEHEKKCAELEQSHEPSKLQHSLDGEKS